MSQWEEDTPHGHPFVNTPRLSLRVPPSDARVFFYTPSVRVVTPGRTPTSTAEYLHVIDVKDAHARTLYEWYAKKKKKIWSAVRRKKKMICTFILYIKDEPVQFTKGSIRTSNFSGPENWKIKINLWKYCNIIGITYFNV